MPPRISSSRVPAPQTCQCFRTRPRDRRQFHASVRDATRLRRDMWAWFKGPGKVFRAPLPASTNYLSAYDKQGNLLRTKPKPGEERDDGRSRRERQQLSVDEDEDAARQRDLENKDLTDEDRDIRAEERALNRATRSAEVEEQEARGGIPKERLSDLRPYPLNPNFRSQPVLSEELREQLYVQVAVYKHDLSSVAASFGVDIRRVAAVVRLKTVEKQWLAEGKRLAEPYSKAVLQMLPTTPFKPDTSKPVTPHEPINDLPVHARTRQQIFYPAPESRQFTREDAAKVFDPRLLPADKRIPLPMLVDLEKWKLEGLSREDRTKRQIEADRKAQEESEEKERKQRDWEARTQRVVPGRRWDFKFQDISAEKGIARDGRVMNKDVPGIRYGMAHLDRKRGSVKIPTSVD